MMLVAQAPGEVENKNGKMFIGPSGKIIDELLNIARVHRKNIYMTNLIKCMLPRCRKPKSDEIDTCSRYLETEIEIVAPEVIVPLGYYATRYFFEKHAIDVPPKKEFRDVFGKLLWVGEYKIFPLRHPAALLYNLELRETMEGNYRKLKIISQNCKWNISCPMRQFWLQGQLDEKWIQLNCRGDWENCIRFQMEEHGEYHPDWMLPDGTIDENLKNQPL